ncbi:MAG: RNA polymerase sigma factor [Candidatus Dormibacteria bacterium]
MDDEALLERARRGDRDAFTDLVHRYQDGLYTMALRLLGQPADAADVVQEAFTRAYLHRGSLQGASVRGWLYRVTTNCARDVQRQALRRPTSALEDESGRIIDLPDPDLGPEATALQRERSTALRAAIRELPLEFRRALVLRDVSELAYEEIAVALGIPLGTVKSRISRARTMLATSLRGSSLLVAQGE